MQKGGVDLIFVPYRYEGYSSMDFLLNNPDYVNYKIINLKTLIRPKFVVIDD